MLTASGRYSATVTGIAQSDSAAGPAFALVNTIIVPVVQPVHQVRARIAGGAAARYFVAVPEGASGLSVAIAVPDSTRQGSLNLYEPTGQPARGTRSEDVGGANGDSVTIAVTGNDIMPGVWEVVVQALPGAGLIYDLDVRTTPARITRIDSLSAHPSVSLESGGDAALVIATQQVGADTAWTETVVNALARRTFAVPAWAARMIAEVEVTPGIWDQVTDFAITIYDAEGAQLDKGAMNYPFHRLSADLPADRAAGYRATLELFPGFARPTPTTIQARVKVRFEADSQAIVTRSPVAFRLQEVPLQIAQPLELPTGWRRVVRVMAGKSEHDPLAMTRLISVGTP
jgi:hypothetical protein